MTARERRFRLALLKQEAGYGKPAPPRASSKGHVMQAPHLLCACGPDGRVLRSEGPVGKRGGESAVLPVQGDHILVFEAVAAKNIQCAPDGEIDGPVPNSVDFLDIVQAGDTSCVSGG